MVIVEEREFQGVFKEMLVIVYFKKMIVCFICRSVVKLLQEPAVCLCYVELAAERLPSGYMRRNYIEIVSAEEKAYYRLVRAFAFI